MRANSLWVLAAVLLGTASLPAPALAQDVGVVQSGVAGIRPGDRIVLSVVDEPVLTDTFTVAAGPTLMLPLVGMVSLAGVSRDALEAHLTTVIARVIRNPVVSAQTLVRIAVLGEVARPGFFAIPADALLSDAITLAGGPTGNAEMRRLTLSRLGTVLQRDDVLRQSIAEGRTIDDLGIAAGDELMVPRRRDSERAVRILALLVGIPFSIFVITRM